MSRRDLPSVDRLLTQAGSLVERYGRPLTTQAFRDTLEAAREQLGAPPGDSLASEAPSAAALLRQAEERLQAATHSDLRPVINATGVIIHTNLGRAPLSAAALAEVAAVARGYSSLEYDLEAGERG
ncbi:MAG: L-seryl-tRNA(Sec) selenium transferase, partial [Anaerolineales bacterium]